MCIVTFLVNYPLAFWINSLVFLQFDGTFLLDISWSSPLSCLPADCLTGFLRDLPSLLCALLWGPSTPWALRLRWPPLLPSQQKYSPTMWRLFWWVQTTLVFQACCLDTGDHEPNKKCIIARVVLDVPFPRCHEKWKIWTQNAITVALTLSRIPYFNVSPLPLCV